ncbi:MAG: hypothetical protein K8S55_08265 [Phycisphaerae bacterium]|nr:hypothetical protein [Phycisphaerae bacterium]
MLMKSIVFKELPIHDACWAITTGADGNVYVGVCGELTGGLSVFIVRYDPAKDEYDYLLEASPALGEPTDSGRSPHSKIHYCLLPATDGTLYCATHFSGPGLDDPIWRPWHVWDDPQRMAEGFHIFHFDPKTEALEDFGVMSPNEGCRAMAFAEKRGLLYGVTWPRNHFFVYDINKRQYRDLGRFCDVNPQVVWTDSDENGYTVDDLGYIMKYDADADKLFRLDARVPIDPSSTVEARSAYDVIPSPDGKSVYGSVWNMEINFKPVRLFKYDFAEEKVYDLGPGLGEDDLDHVGALIFGDDGMLYYTATKKAKNRIIPFKVYLFRMNPDTLEKEEIGPVDDGDWHSTYIAKATKDLHGNLYFADTNNRPERIYVYTPEKTDKDTPSKQPIVRAWG